MFFRDEDPVCIHALAEAACRNLDGLKEDHGKSQEGGDLIKEEARESFSGRLSESRNFIQHGEPHSRYPFDPAFNHVSLLAAVNMYFVIKKQHVPETFVFLVWYDREYPGQIKEDRAYAVMLETVSRALPDQQNKPAWYNFIRMLRRGRILGKEICLESGL